MWTRRAPRLSTGTKLRLGLLLFGPPLFVLSDLAGQAARFYFNP
jgi:hypothetical protein